MKRSASFTPLVRTLRSSRSPGTSIVPVLIFLLVAASLMGLATSALANVYASGLAKTGDMAISYILNENADTGVQIQVWKVGGAMVHSEDLGAQAKGAHTWTWNGLGSQPGQAYTIKIVASDDGYAAWTQISTDATSTSFYSPVGIAVNKMQSSASFGRMFVSNATAGLTAGPKRNCLDGIYTLNADGSDAGFTTGGVTWTGTSSPWKSLIGPDGHLYVTDLSNDLAYEFSSDMTTATRLIDGTNKTTNQYVGAMWVSGTGADRKLYLANVNGTDSARKGLIAYDCPGTQVATGNTGTQYIAPKYYGASYYPYDIARDSSGDWYSMQYRANAGNLSPITKFRDGTPPLDTDNPVWTIPPATYYYAYDLDICESKDWAAYGKYNDGIVQFFSMADGHFVGQFDAGSRMRAIAFDAAANLVTVDNTLEWLRVWSPAGGANSFTTESWFTLDVAGAAYPVTINVSPAGSGTVTGAGDYFAEQPVTVTALENVGCKFQKWTDVSGNQLSTSESYTLAMPSGALTINAVFVASTQRRLSLAAVPSEAAQSLTGGGMYEPGSHPSVSATAANLWEFSKWTSDPAGNNVVSTSASFSYTMPGAPTTLYAQFAVARFNVAVIANPTAGGSPVIDGGPSQTYGTDVTVRANVPSDGYCFVNWTSNADGTGVVSRKPNYTFTMPANNVTLYANYARALFVEGFEGLVRGTSAGRGTLDMNYTSGDNKAANGDLNSGNPWWGTNPYNGSVGLDPVLAGATVHSGQNSLWSGYAGNGRNYLNLGYRLYQGSGYFVDAIYIDWWFYDPWGTGWGLALGNYCDDPLSLVYAGVIPTDTDAPENAATHNFDESEFGQKISLGMANDWCTIEGLTPSQVFTPYAGFDHTKYQVRIKNDGTGVSDPASYANGWYNVDVTRSIGWHHGRIVVGALDPGYFNPVTFYLDNMAAPVHTGRMAPQLNAVELMTEWKPGDSSTVVNWPDGAMYDDITIGSVPMDPPAAPGAAAASGVTTTAITWNWTQSGTRDGFHVYDAAVIGAQKANTTALSLSETGLVANTLYSRWVVSYYAPVFESTRTALAPTYTLASVPTVGTNVQTTATGTGVYDASTWPGFTNPQGFGTGNKVSSFRYKWSASASDSIAEGEGTVWETGTMTATPSSDGTYYLYLRSYNGGSVGNGSTKMGPFKFQFGTPVAKISDLWPLTNGPTYILSNKAVTGVVGGAFWIEESDRSAAIKVVYSGTVTQDHAVDVTGVLDSSGGQRVLVASSAVDKGALAPANVIKPLVVVERSAGGMGINANTPSIAGGNGLYNIGMLVRIAGTAGGAGAGFFYLDDGSGMTDSGNAGVKVLCGAVPVPAPGTKTVTGLVGVENGKPVLVIRGVGDIQ